LKDFSLHKLNEPQKFFRLWRAEKKAYFEQNNFKLIPDTGPLLGSQNFRLWRAEKNVLSKNNFKLVPNSSAAVNRTSKFLRLRRAKRMFLKNNFNRFLLGP
jgi:hypothetical protein